MAKTPRTLLLTWLALLSLLAIGAGATALAPGIAAQSLAIGCAAGMIGLILRTFMGLGGAGGLARSFALGAWLWLGLLITLSLADYLTR